MYASLPSFERSYQEIQKPRSAAPCMNELSLPSRSCVVGADYSRLRAASQVPNDDAPLLDCRLLAQAHIETKEPRDGHIPGLGPRAHLDRALTPPREPHFRSRTGPSPRSHLTSRPLRPLISTQGEPERAKARHSNGDGGLQTRRDFQN